MHVYLTICVRRILLPVLSEMCTFEKKKKVYAFVNFVRICKNRGLLVDLSARIQILLHASVTTVETDLSSCNFAFTISQSTLISFSLLLTKST